MLLKNPFDVPRETKTKIEKYICLLLEWNEKINLIGKSTINDIWQRHIVDSLQLMLYIDNDQKIIVDLGSGAGFPGIVLSMAGIKKIILIEKDKRKAAFLQQAASLCENEVIIISERIENIRMVEADIITARALAPLTQLLELTIPLIRENTECLFFKGQRFEEEIKAANQKFNMNYSVYPSITQEGAAIISIKELKRRR
jgi:16S rRNA (guanine527-N7)-methyltransferase